MQLVIFLLVGGSTGNKLSVVTRLSLHEQMLILQIFWKLVVHVFWVSDVTGRSWIRGAQPLMVTCSIRVYQWVALPFQSSRRSIKRVCSRHILRLFSGGTQFEFRSEHWLPWQFRIVFLRSSRRMLGYYLKLGYDCFLPCPPRYSLSSSHSTLYTGCFTTLGHNFRRCFPRSFWSKKFI
jgi:hypothetical protein